ncbi:KPN_02809 family neutral zinc metallopeptidase [Sphingomonas sp.]|uniref:KPN_02809 family neutral zinc metallopeptidase n=1 Tax=Sphingomonas sp. TaxID=28214 RepID=UPI002CB844A3|nr:neutral zinc metallopeptidase [Sphingomonas sp.]HWK36327.1 neutral zinc metallopeptidase [Sphingomonas sp.]
MRLDDLDPSNNVRDLGSGGGGGGGGGLSILGLLPLLLGRRMGCGTIGLLVVVGVIYLAMSGGGGGLLSGGDTSAPTQQSTTAGGSGAKVCNTAERLFSCRVLASTEQVWGKIFEQNGQRYQPPVLNFYQGGTQSGCGAATSAAGPFYCPPDHGVFLDTSFFDELQNRFGAKGDFAEAYVIAHEVGHHIQTLTGTSEQVTRQQQRAGRAQGNALSVRLELQADCYAGVWGRLSGRMEPGDVEEGLVAANAIGDDTLQKQAQGTVVPDSFTHGSSAERVKWLRRGLETGDPAQCDTFSGSID